MRVWTLGLVLVASSAAAGPVDEAQSSFAAGKRAFDAGDFETALVELEYTFLFAASPNAAFNIAAALEKLGRHHDAAAAFERWLELTPNDPAAGSVRARAAADHARAGDKTPTSLIAEAKRADAAADWAFEHKDYPTAIVEFLRAYFLCPSPTLVLNLGVALESTGQYRRAALVFDRYLELAPAPKNDEQRKALERTRARADAIRYRHEPAPAPAPEPAPPPEPAPAPKPVDEGGINLIVHGPANKPDKQKRCMEALHRAGITLDPVASVTAVLTLGKPNRLQIVHQQRGVLRDETQPPYGMEQLCVEAANAALRELR